MQNTAKQLVRRRLKSRKPPMTQGELAAALGISAPHLSNLLNGKRRMSLHMAIALEQHTGVPAKSFAEVA